MGNEANDRALTLRFRAGERHYAFALAAVEAIAGYATLRQAEEKHFHGAAFRGWLGYRGADVPVFDLGMYFGGSETPAQLGSRIMLFTRLHDAGARIGLLAAEITDTTAMGDLAGVELLQPEPLLRDLLGEAQ